jgi:uncharacterized protein YfdQ (DUF2303 family)
MTMLSEQAITKISDLGIAASDQSNNLIEHENGMKSFIIPEGFRVELIKPIELKLSRITQSVILHDGASLIDYVNTFKGAGSRVFAEPSFLAASRTAHISALVDYHVVDQPSHVTHTAVYHPRFSDQWMLWHKACAEPMDQAAFAEFIEENRADIREPLAAQLLDIVRTFKASRKVAFDSVVYQPNGDVSLGYEDKTVQTGTSGTLPEKLKLGIPVYFRGDLYEVPVWVRYRVGDGKVKFQLKMDRSDLIEAQAFDAVVASVATGTALPIHLGRPK